MFDFLIQNKVFIFISSVYIFKPLFRLPIFESYDLQ